MHDTPIRPIDVLTAGVLGVAFGLLIAAFI